MTEPQVIELWPCGYVARCSARECRRRATTILRYLDNQEPEVPLRIGSTMVSDAKREFHEIFRTQDFSAAEWCSGSG
jgi:hypothetical protein